MFLKTVLPVPLIQTPCRQVLSSARVLSLQILSIKTTGSFCLSIPPAYCIEFTRYGFIILPLLATALYNVSVCSGLTSTSYPNAIQGSVLALQVRDLGDLIMGEVSPARSMPVTRLSLNFLR